MSELAEVYDKLERTLAGYRAHDNIDVSQETINAWAQQFTHPWVDLPAVGKPGRRDLLQAIADELERSYWSEERIRRFLREAVIHPSLVGDSPVQYWRKTTVLNIQKKGGSQRDMIRLLEDALQEQLQIRLSDCANDYGQCLYIDDGLFTGNRMIHDITDWATSGSAPESFHLQALFLISHTNGERWVRKQLEQERLEVSARLHRSIELKAATRIRNLPAQADQSGVLWPTFIPAGVARYWKARSAIPGGVPVGFTSEPNRQILEKYLLQAGTRICERIKDQKPYWQPLGFSHFFPGFGSMFATYRNCPNNVPLPLWWDLDWHPLLPRKTNRDRHDFGT